MAKVRFDELAPGKALVVLATDPEAPVDIGAWAADHGHAVEVAETDGWLEITVRPAGA